MSVFVRFWIVFDVGMCERNSQSKILWLLFKTVWVLHKNCEFSPSSCISMVPLPTVPLTLSELPPYHGHVYISPLPASCPCPSVSGPIESYIFNLYMFWCVSGPGNFWTSLWKVATGGRRALKTLPRDSVWQIKIWQVYWCIRGPEDDTRQQRRGTEEGDKKIWRVREMWEEETEEGLLLRWRRLNKIHGLVGRFFICIELTPEINSMKL